MVCGDFNAKIGEQGPIGKHAVGVRNDNGERFTQFAVTTGLYAANAIVKCHLEVV